MTMFYRTLYKKAVCLLTLLCVTLAAAAGLSVRTAAQPDTETVRVGYYENEVFQEGAAENAVKTGYAYEYYRKISEYTGWSYEYVYGDFTEMYEKLLNGEIDLRSGRTAPDLSATRTSLWETRCTALSSTLRTRI